MKSQIEHIWWLCRKTPFKGMPVKHFLGSDDIKTLEWIQKLGSKKTVLTENVSRGTSSSFKRTNATQSENYSISETATDLIQFNDIREMPENEQYVFIKGIPPIRCKKAYYFLEPIYQGKYDANPIENRAKLEGVPNSKKAIDTGAKLLS